MRNRYLLFILLCGFLAISIFAADAAKNSAAENLTPNSPPNPLLSITLIDRKSALMLAKDATVEKFPDADEVLVSSATRVDYRLDGTYTQLDESYVKILTEKGRRENLVINSHFTIPYQLQEDCQIPLVEIIKPDGTVNVIDLATQSTVTINPKSMEANIYNPNSKIISVNITGLAVGDILHYRMYDNIRQPRAHGFFVDFFSLEQPRPIMQMTIAINGLKDFPLQQTILRDEIPDTVKYETKILPDGNPQYLWTITNIPQAFPEPKMPALYTCTQRLLVSTAQNWEEASRWYANLCKPALAAITPAITNEVAKIVGDVTDPHEKVTRLFTWVSQQIRYMGVTTEATSPGYEPHLVSETFNARHGVCRDKAALLAAMLEIAGIEAHPVLISAKAKKDLAAVNTFFDHAITAAKINGEYILMDPTDENARELLPAYLSNKQYLVANVKGETLHTSPIIPATQNTLTINTTGALNANGDLTAETIIKFDGINDTVYRGYFSTVTPIERRRFFESCIRSVYADAELTNWSLTPENPQDTTQPLSAKIQFSARNILVRKQNLTMVPLPFLSTRLGVVNFLLGKIDLDQRRFPLEIASTCGVNENVKIDLPDELNSEISMPVYKPINNDEIEWKRSVARVGKALLGRNEFLIKTVEFSPPQYLALKESLKTIEYDSQKMPLFAQKNSPNETLTNQQNDCLIMRDDVECEYLDEHSWRERRIVRKKILTYGGLKKHSEITESFYAAYETLKLESANVTAPNGKIQAIGAHEVNIMDQAWNASAPRYRGGKVLVAGLPSVEVGSIIEYKIVREVTAQPFFYLREVFADFEPLLRRTLTLRAPKYDHFNTVATLNVDYEETVDGAQMWSINNEPAVKPEDDLPPASSFMPSVFISTAKSWPDYAKIVREKIISAAVSSPTIDALRQKLLGEQQQLTLVAVRELVAWFAQNIRLAGPSFAHQPLNDLTTAAQTLQDGYGNTTDRAILLLALLHKFEPEIFLVSNFPQADNLPLPQLTLPTPQFFHKVLVRVKVENRTVWLNELSQYNELGTTASNGMLALNLQNGAIEPIRVDRAFDDSDEINYLVELNDNGTALIRKTTIITGERYGLYKKMFAEMTPEQRRRHQQNEITALSQSAVAEGEYTSNFSAYPGKIEFSARAHKYAVVDGEFLYFNIPQALRGVLNLRSTERDNPLFIDTPIRVRVNTDIILPAQMLPLIFPSKYSWQSPISPDSKIFVESLYGVGMAAGKNVLRINQNVNLTPAYYVPALYSELLKVQNRLSHNNARTVLLASKKWLDLQKMKATSTEKN